MAIITVDVLSVGIAQGTITTTGPNTNPTRVHSVGFIPLEFIGTPPSNLTISATTSTGKALDVAYVIYNSQNYTDITYDPDEWFRTPCTADLSELDNVNYIATYARYFNNSDIPPSDVTAWTITYDNGINYGAFENSDIERVKIPKSVKTIGNKAFAGTKLRHVRIAADATISDTSVPEGCIVTRYPDDRYEQVYDGQGRMVLDRDARRILMRRTDSNG